MKYELENVRPRDTSITDETELESHKTEARQSNDIRFSRISTRVNSLEKPLKIPTIVQNSGPLKGLSSSSPDYVENEAEENPLENYNSFRSVSWLLLIALWTNAVTYLLFPSHFKAWPIFTRSFFHEWILESEMIPAFLLFCVEVVVMSIVLFSGIKAFECHSWRAMKAQFLAHILICVCGILTNGVWNLVFGGFLAFQAYRLASIFHKLDRMKRSILSV